LSFPCNQEWSEEGTVNYTSALSSHTQQNAEAQVTTVLLATYTMQH
jgi:hypothetical protein